MPSWDYSGFDSFPAMFFGGNRSAPGLDNATQLAFMSRHPLVGLTAFGQNDLDSDAARAASAAGNRSGYSARAAEWQYDNLEALTQLLHGPSRPPNARTRGQFLYRQGMYALYYFESSNYFLSRPELLWRDQGGRLCWKADGALYNFSAPGFEDAFMSQVIDPICAAKRGSSPNIGGVFFDGVDGFGFAHGYKPGASLFASNCTNTLTFKPADFLGMMASQARVFATAGRRLNDCGIWPIYSLGNAIDPAVSASRGYPAPENVTLEALRQANVTWTRYYEFWETGPWGVGCGYNVENAIAEAEEWGVPTSAHAYPAGGGQGGVFNTSATFSVAAFLVAQSDYAYYGISAPDMAYACATEEGQWADCGWAWHREYDATYGRPRGAARRVGDRAWVREFDNALVFVDEVATRANITLLNPRMEFLAGYA